MATDGPTDELTIAEVAALLGVSRMTVYRLIYGGELAAHRIGLRGRPYRVLRHHAEAQRQTVQPKTA